MANFDKILHGTPEGYWLSIEYNKSVNPGCSDNFHFTSQLPLLAGNGLSHHTGAKVTGALKVKTLSKFWPVGQSRARTADLAISNPIPYPLRHLTTKASM